MRRLLELIVKFRAFFFFLGLELICLILIVNYNRFQSAAYFNSSNAVAGFTHSITSGISEYFGLKSGNRELANQNAELHEKLIQLEREKDRFHELANVNKLLKQQVNLLLRGDSAEVPAFTTKADSNYFGAINFIPAKVIKNEVIKENNYITIDKGEVEDIRIGMGVISPQGVVGKVISVSQNYATIKSLLHIDNLTSVELKKNRALGRLKWDGEKINTCSMLDIPRHALVELNDTVITSGYNSVFHEGIIVGTIDHLELEQDDAFYHLSVKLSTDFTNLYFVYVVDNRALNELKALELKTKETENE